MLAGPHHHLALTEMTTDGTTVEVVTALIVVSNPSPGGIVGAATRSRGPRGRSPPHRESARDWDRSRDYERRRDDSRDKYRDRRH